MNAFSNSRFPSLTRHLTQNLVGYIRSGTHLGHFVHAHHVRSGQYRGSHRCSRSEGSFPFLDGPETISAKAPSEQAGPARPAHAGAPGSRHSAPCACRSPSPDRALCELSIPAPGGRGCGRFQLSSRWSPPHRAWEVVSPMSPECRACDSGSDRRLSCHGTSPDRLERQAARVVDDLGPIVEGPLGVLRALYVSTRDQGRCSSPSAA